MSEAPTNAADAPKPTGGRWGRRIFLLMLAVAALAFFAPAIISHTAVGRSLLDKVGESLPPGSRVGGVSLSWLHPVGVTDFVYRDDEGRELVVDEVATDTTLWSMLVSQKPPKTLTFRGIDLTINLDAPEPLPNFGDAAGESSEDGSAVEVPADVPNVRVERLHVTLRNGPLREPVLLSIETAAVDRDESGRFAVDGVGGLIAGEHVAPLTVTGLVDVADSSGEGRLIVSDLDPAGVLSRLHEPPILAAGPLKMTLTARQSPDGRTAGEFGLSGPTVRLRGTAADSPEVTVRELRVLTKAEYLADQQRIDIDTAKFGADLLRGELAGGVNLATAEPEVSLDGRVELLGPAVALAGLPEGVSLSEVRFEPLAMRTRGRQLAMRGEMTWPEASAFGLASRNGRVTYDLDPSAATVTLADVPVGTGRAVGTYQVDLTRDVPRLRFAGGPVLRDVTLTEDLCRQWLQYVSPAMSRATEVSGQFGLTLAPLDVPLDGSVPAMAGQLEIGGANLRPGPVADQLVGSVQMLSSLGIGKGKLSELAGRADGRQLATLPPQSVPFAADASGVAHRGFTLQSGGAGVTTEGRVGFDDRIDAVAMISLPEKWTRDRPVLASMASRPLRVPVTGTLNDPRLDRSAFQGLGKRAAGAAAGGLLRKLIDR